ncbi:hypothetical protein LTR47_000365 [Exophiala xenobiotica]|nr:hypothetical protein LTR47_000365 [Exophiala xenobiotica]KAK5350050.1 hypothetical protein LTR61_006025 [Exophiala xenobiotica]KAK5387429.1 hypothetical protein LTR11_001094 [Exophiala xenobiotica]KAK5388789.1 hypothetical protein LTS03_001210 [Exophiala xenobiotica]
MSSQSDHGSGPSEYLSGPEQHRRLDLSANEPTFHTAPDHEPGFVLTLTDPEFAEFLMQRLQLAVAKDVRISPTLRSCLEDIDKHDILNKIDIEVSYVVLPKMVSESPRLAAASFLCPSGPASTYLYPKPKDIRLTLTPTLRKLYDYRKEEEVQDTIVSRSSLAGPQKARQKEQDCLKRHQQEDGSL